MQHKVQTIASNYSERRRTEEKGGYLYFNRRIPQAMQPTATFDKYCQILEERKKERKKERSHVNICPLIIIPSPIHTR
ncbi:hypothetical protein COCC4DRAFT_68598 [Bipolaris maydis ATCC 48331]|uniref:Uncharacterized protein n=1 Tax=Cochliobolus heterostrophus (strain C4 / ATCC 48331 / race T) TaxID=665024 RepID=N4XV15_COCH4|nr:uncharacterized protein COCC4DRAFT_68598 [Bipolaris maydis ATCC 48331]ENI09007.1 hypothetical protein COCC4DRAFT_68598 [Bipolaris maydis ATCC 48331]